MSDDDLKRTALVNVRCGAVGFLAGGVLTAMSVRTHRWDMLAMNVALLLFIGFMTRANYRVYDELRRDATHKGGNDE